MWLYKVLSPLCESDVHRQTAKKINWTLLCCANSIFIFFLTKYILWRIHRHTKLSLIFQLSRLLKINIFWNMPMYNQTNNMSLFFGGLMMKLLIKVRTPVEKTERFCNLIDFICRKRCYLMLFWKAQYYRWDQHPPTPPCWH